MSRELSRHYRVPRLSATSLSSSRRFRSFAPDAACLSASLRSIHPNSETFALGALPFLLVDGFRVAFDMEAIMQPAHYRGISCIRSTVAASTAFRVYGSG